MSFIRLKVRTRIYLGFAALVVLSLGIAIFGIMQDANIGLNVGKMDALAGNTNRVLTVARKLEAMRRSETRYLLDAPAASMKDAQDNASESDKLLTDAAAVSLSEERRKAYLAVQGALRAHVAELDKYRDLSATWVAERAKLFSGGDVLTAATNKLVAAARASNDQAIANAAEAVERTILLVRVANWRFMATEDKGGVGTFHTNSDNANAAIAALQHNASTDVAPAIAPVQAALADYQAAFAAYSTARLAVGTLYNDKMRPEIVAMQAQLDATATSLAQGFDASRTTAVDTISSASTWQEILAVVALVIGTGLAFVIGRGIVGPLSSWDPLESTCRHASLSIL